MRYPIRYTLQRIGIALLLVLSLCFCPSQTNGTQATQRQVSNELGGSWYLDCKIRKFIDGQLAEETQYENYLNLTREPDGRYSLTGFGSDSIVRVTRVGSNEYAGDADTSPGGVGTQRIVVKVENEHLTLKSIHTFCNGECRDEESCTGRRPPSDAIGSGVKKEAKEEPKSGALGYNNCFPASSYDPNDIPDESISSRFDEAKPFSEGLAAIAKTPPGMRNAKWGFVEKSGRLVIDLRYDVVTPFFGGLAGVGNFVGQERSAKWGVINRRGIMLPTGQVYPSHDAVKILGEGFAAIGEIPRSNRSAKWYIINAQGIRFLRLPLCDFVDCFVGGRARASYSDSVGNVHIGYVDTTGRFYEDPKRR